MGRPFRFPFDLSFSGPPTPTEQRATDVHAFLRLASPTAQFSEQVLRLLTDERRALHRERANSNRTQVHFQIGDLVMARSQVHSSAPTGVVAKLSYRKRGPYEIIGTNGFGSYKVRRFGDPDAPILKYPTQSLSALPPALLPCSPIDTPDFRYLNHSHAPLPHPLRKPFDIQMYNNLWFSKDLALDHLPLFKFTDELHTSTISSPTTTIASIPAAIAIPIFDSEDDPFIPPFLSNCEALYSAILASVDRLFFVCYSPDGTLRPRWYLIQVDLSQSSNDTRTASHQTNGLYYCPFHSKHPDDLYLPDPTSRYWPLWHHFTTAADNVLEFGKRILFSPSVTPDPNRYIAWADCLSLVDPNVCLFGPFDFCHPTLAACGRTPASRQILHFDLWAALTTVCTHQGILPPILATPPNIRSRWTRPSR